ncbi:MAG: FecR domain-containing protein [Bacteroides sp.]|uniref:FecR family protein n=1 Tax=Bacteroides sp. TaxID=29523 RepID=UPI002FCB9D9A
MKNYIQQIIRIFTVSEPEQSVTDEVHQWLIHPEHAEEKEKALHSVWEVTEGVPDADTWNSLSNVYRKAGIPQIKHTRKQPTLWRYAAAVALLVVSVSVTFFYTKDTYSDIAMVEKFTSYGELNSVVLPDGSTVQTNSGTLLFYPESFKGDTRTVYLMGEANFKVKKNPDQPFIVKSATVSVMALGTEFNVSAYPKDSKIVATLLSGKIQVDCNDSDKSYTLAPGQQIIYDKNTASSHINQANISDVTAWQRGTLVFRGSTVAEMLTILERRYDIKFQCDANYVNEDKYNFEFPGKSNIKEVMDIMQVVVGDFNYEFEVDVCYIKSKKKK